MSWSSTMVGCRGNVPQSEAHALCGPGWHLCSMEEYFVRGGAAEAPTISLWLSGCIDETGCLVDGICAASGAGTYPYSNETCSGSPVSGGTYTINPLGVYAYRNPAVLGCGVCAYWLSGDSVTGTMGAVCCR